MSIPAFSAAWATALATAINADDAFATAAKGWTNIVALVVAPHELLPAGAAVEVDLQAGACNTATALPPDEVSATFVLTADMASWKEIIGGTADPLMAVATGRVKLTQGSLATLMMHSRAAKALLVCTRKIATLWT